MNRELVKKAGCWVVKIGSSLVTNQGRGLNLAAIQQLSDQISALRTRNKQVVLVSSGAVAEGMVRLNWKKRPHALHELQAAAAVGQMGLVQAYESQFQRHRIHTAQVLLSRDDLTDRTRYINARSTLRTLLKLGVVPIINENDTVATEEIRFGDNDTLAALVANLVESQLLVIMTDKDGLYDRDPGKHAGAKLIASSSAEDRTLDSYAGPSGGELGRGGMITKISAARRAARSGAATLIVSGTEPELLVRLSEGEPLGTLLLPGEGTLAARKQWIANHLKPCGVLHLDAGAVRVLLEKGSSLLAVGVTRVEGTFGRGDVVVCLSPEGREVARGLVNYDSSECERIKSRPSAEIEAILGYVSEPELVHRDNLALS
jgi:glutamate 5-kinase